MWRGRQQSEPFRATEIGQTLYTSVARWSRRTPILVIFFTETSPSSVSQNLVPRIARKMGSCRLVSAIIANVLRLITPFYYTYYC
jgi:hypothetical protein